MECLSLLTDIYWSFAIISCFLVVMNSRFAQLHAYGKLRRATQSSIFLVRKTSFWHFYVVAILWSMLLLYTCYMVEATSNGNIGIFRLIRSVVGFFGCPENSLDGSLFVISEGEARRVYVSLLAILVHALIRLYECFFLFDRTSPATMHILGYLVGMSYYIVAPWSFVLRSQFWTGGHEKGHLFEVDIWEIKYGIALMLYLVASYHQHSCHRILAQLRTKTSVSTNKVRYKIPRGDWFEYVSTPHYLSEILLYFSILLLNEFDLTIALLFGFVVGNLTVTALKTHKWYKEKFKDYPRSRKAIFPWIL